MLENALFAWLQHIGFRRDIDSVADEDGIVNYDYLAPPGEEDDVTDEYTAQAWPGRDADECWTLKLIGRTIKDALWHDSITKLSDYEAKLLRQAKALLAQLRDLSANRDRGHDKPGGDHQRAANSNAALLKLAKPAK